MADNITNSLSNNEVVKQGNNEYRRTVQQLPAFYRTDSNQRFLSSTVDPFVQKGALERLDGYIGRQDAYTRGVNDRYINATSRDRYAYQLEPAVTYTNRDTTSVNPEDQVRFTGTYDDYINQIKYFGGLVNNHDRLNKERVYSWNPAIDYDKLINYREYYWIPEGPGSIQIDSVGPSAVAEYKVENLAQGAYNFSHRENENNPTLTLYRGNTYKFNVNAKGHPFYIMTEPYKDGSTDLFYKSGVTNAGAVYGTVTFTVPKDAPDILYYQCGNHNAMGGILQIKDITATTEINPADDIIGAKNYSLRTLDLSNGMKIKFTNSLVGADYKDKEYYVEGVGDAITLTDVEDMITPGSYSTESTVLYDAVGYDTRPYAKSFYTPDNQDYITIKRDSRDQNAWSRYNRWFHREVIEETARVGGFTPTLDENSRAKRPIIEFDSGLALYNHGTVAKKSVTLLDTVTTDAFSTVVKQTGYIIDGLPLEDGMRVVFTADTDSTVKNKIYTVNFVTAGDSTQVISLTEATDSTASADDSIFIEFGLTNQGKTLHYDGVTGSWKESQQKTGVNQQPLFSMFDNDHTSFDDATKYPNSSFVGASVFKFSTSDTATTDTVLGIKVKYNTVNNVGDIVFESDHTSGTFTYKSGKTTLTKNLAEGHLHYTTSKTTHNNKSAWVERTNLSKQRVVRTFTVGSTEKKLFPIDCFDKSANISDLEVSVLVNGERKTLLTDFTLVNGTKNKYVKFNKDQNTNDQIRLAVYSANDKVEAKGIYEVPENLSTNSSNDKLGTFTYGQILRHVRDIFDKNTSLVGSVPGATNLRDNPDARLLGGTIHQHEGPLMPAIFGLIDQESNLINAIEYTTQEYEKWYDSFLTHAVGTAYEGVAADRVDEIIASITQGRNSSFPFFNEDMLGHGENVTTRSYTVQGSSQTEYAIDSMHDITKSSNRAVYVYLNDVQLLLGSHYTFSTTDDSVNITATLAEGDKIVIKDYADTKGSYMPVSPTKLGIYPKYTPELFTDDTYITSTSVIRKHDGSIIKAYGDERDSLILELEKRIYNNLKTNYDNTLLQINDIMPSAFTSTEYKLSEVDSVMASDFYSWAGRGNVQYINNTTFVEGSPFTYNYALSTSKKTGDKLPGYWRAIYKFYYDTDAPHVRPWEMLGHSEKPSDWDDTYGPAPYTSGNNVLWDKIAGESGRYGKPTINDYLPVDASGNLLDPLQIGLVKDLDIAGRSTGWKFGDQAPAETAWRRSSSYPFTVIKTLALTKPAKFFSNFFDNSRLTTNVAGNQIDKDTGIRATLGSAKYHLETETDNKTGVTTTYLTAGYQPLIVNYLISRNLDAKTFYYDKMKNLKVQLAYKLGGFTDKENLKILTDSVSPGSTSGSKFIPDENYKILFRTSNPVNSFEYSGVLIEANTDTTTKTDGSTVTNVGGYKVLGYSKAKPFFKFYYPIKNTNPSPVSVEGSIEVKKYESYHEQVQTVPYGHVFNTIQDVADFLFGYGHYLEDQGFKFNKFSNELKETLNWTNAVREFLFWTTQKWTPGSAVTVSPAADGFELDTTDSIVGRMKNQAGDYSILDSGGRKIDIRELSTKRLGKTFELAIKSPDVGLYNIALNTVQKEHILLFDNKTVFSDIIYEPYTGFRQQRLKLVGWKTAGWNGDYYAPGFVFDAAQVTYWSANTDYRIGDSVEYQGKFYVAKSNHNSGGKFETESWTLKTDKPAPQLIPNFEYKISQFNDFYDLETNNFDESQQKLAQRLIGYKSRDYLENLFVNDVSQYKFYHGFIKEKGTQNAIDKLLKAKYEGEDIDLQLYPEWMIRTGNIGNTDSTESIQIILPEAEIRSDPQSIELLETTNDTADYSRSKGVAKENLFYKPVEYDTSSTFSQLDYTKQGVDKESAQVYKTAGYPQLEQVQHTAFNITDLFNLDVSRVKSSELIWVANKSNKDWDVFRLTAGDFKISTVRTVNSATQLEIVFTGSHGLSQGTQTTEPDYFAISNSEEETMNGVHQVSSVIDHKTVVIDYEGNTAFIPALDDGSTSDSYGNIYKFVSVRFDSMDNVNDRLNYSVYKDRDDSIELEGDKVFADNDTSNLWRVYEKQDPYTLQTILSPDTATAGQEFGHRVVARNDGRTIVASSPGKGQGTVNFLFRSIASAGNIFRNQSSVTTTVGNDTTGRLGESLSMSTDENFVVAGAPYANSIGSDGSTRFADAGAIKIFLWDPDTFKYGTLVTRRPPTDAASQNFGWAHKIAEPGSSSTRSTPTKYMFVSSPGLTSDKGRVYMYEWGIGADGSTYDTWTQCATIDSPEGGSGQRFGHRLEINDNGDILAVSSLAPGNAGKVDIFVRSSQSNDDSVTHSFTHMQTLTGVSADGSSLNTQFGDSIAMSKDGTMLVIGAPGVDKVGQDDGGAVYTYKWNADGSTNTYTLQQTIEAPDPQGNMRFGTSLSINQSGTRLVIGADNFSSTREMKLDNGETTFDLQDTTFIDINKGSGSAYTATMYNTKFAIDDRLVTDSVTEHDKFGKGVCAIDDTIIVGAPSDDGNVTSDGSTRVQNDGTVSCFDLSVSGQYAWKNITTETPLMDIEKAGHVFDFNNKSKQIRDHYDLYDPVKGRILGIADREIGYKTMWDPAAYNTGEESTQKTPWGAEHIGEVWWDLSTVKWLWYEQDTQEYKFNHWGQKFPGSRIDIYEWTESPVLPSVWNTRSGTQQGVKEGISGVAAYFDDSRYNVVRKYNSAVDRFVNVYYFWVRNRSTVPMNSVVPRKNSTAFVRNIIDSPQNFSYKYYSITDTNKLIINNIGGLVNSDIVLNVDIRTNTFEGDSHSVWKLAREGDKDWRPGLQIETRWWDSLTGKNTAGDKVPDINLGLNRRYGNNIRPRQSWYVNRFDALKELIDYANTVLKKHQLVGTINLENLNSKDPEPTAQSLLWDASVDTYAELTYIDTKDLSGTVNYLVKADETANNFWAIYKWDGTEWSRTKLQTYNTGSYWSYVDWYGTDPAIHEMIHSEKTPIDKQVTFQYELDTLDLPIGKHVKVTNSDTGGWKLFMKTATGWANVGTENGTIRLSTKLYDYSQDATGFAGSDNFDDNFFDQEPSTETRKILTALRDDLFINELALEYNTLFFTGLRKVLEEQTYVDWMFKTSFINVKNSVRKLDQRKTYTIGTDNWIESYINEVKPFHTKIREYKLGYTNIETQDGIYTDFDNPTFYDSETGKIRSLNVDLDSDKLTEFPYQMWHDYHKKYVQSITVTHGGSGYQEVPTVTVLGGTIGSTGPFQIQATSSSGPTSGQFGYYYPLFTSEKQAQIYDSQNGGSGTTKTYNFDGYSGNFYGPNSSTIESSSSKSGVFKMYVTPTNTAATATATIQNGAVTRITVTGVGANYNTTPVVIISGGRTDGTTPTDTAKAYANLNNDLVRDIDTTIKFDRVSSTSRVQDWAASTAYAYNDLIRHNNQLYKVTKAFTSTTDFDDNTADLYKVYGDETGLTAADRTKGFYTPGTGMPGNELDQVMTGIDYGGTMVTGLLFNQSQGWDRSGWYDFPWDQYGSSRIKAFRADGTANTFTFDTAPSSSEVFQVYITEDDSTRRKLSDVVRGDGSTVQLPIGGLSITPNANALVEFIPFDDDGVLTPTDDRTLDSIVKGGLFGSALGHAPSDLILEGDDFLSPDTSYAPEETVPGQLFDTVDIKVYTSPESGVPFITEKIYRGNGSTTTFSIGDHPGTLASVTVSVDGVVKKLTTDYTIDVANKTITFGSAPANNSVISTRVFAISGDNYRVLDTFVGDNATASFTTSSRSEFNLDSTVSDIFVTQDGVPRTDFTRTISANTVTITFSAPVPPTGAFIQVAGFNKSATSPTRSFASIRNQELTYASGTNRYTLTYPPGSIGPFSGLTIVELNGRVLRGPDNTYYLGDGSTYTYGVASGLLDDSTVDPPKTISSASQVQVFVNGIQKDLNTHYTVDIGNQNVNFVTASVPTSSDVICISTLVDNQYFNEGTDIILVPSAITSPYSLSAGDKISVTTFNNALGMKQRREVLEGRTGGVFKLRFDTLNAAYTYVWLNGEQLTSGVDYLVNGNTITVSGKTITTSDRLDVMYFALDSATGATGFRIFKDMLNRTFYKRISKTATTKITIDMTEGDKTITVADGSVLPEPKDIISSDGSTVQSIIPGVIFVDKERIEYFTKTNNILGRLKRGTLGTGIKDHGSGTEVVDASGTQTIPYADTVYTNTFTGDGSTFEFTISQTPSSASELDIFIGGQRLLLTSEDGSTINYSVSGANVTLSTIPANGVQIKILHKKGQVWYTAKDGNPADGKGLQASTTQQAKFIANEPTNAPE
tara:strand:+ start:8216 stop:21100 length:12885 start_codon:yes stop_codon:yes gene_type:complete